jgi:O-acetyl-ADP-ribose deacetylase (regulator of RNase III)
MHRADAIVFPSDEMLDYRAAPGSLQSAVEDGRHLHIFEEASNIAKKRVHGGSLDTLVPNAVLPGSVHVTSAGSLDAVNVFHAAVLTYEKDENDQITARTYSNEAIISEAIQNSLELANEKGFKSIAFPVFGGFVYRMSIYNAVELMINEFSSHLDSETTVKRIAMVAPWSLHYDYARQVLEKKFH